MSTRTFAASKLQQFQDVIRTGHALTKGIKSALTTAGYKVTHEGEITHCQKGKAIISYMRSPSHAMVTILRG